MPHVCRSRSGLRLRCGSTGPRRQRGRGVPPRLWPPPTASRCCRTGRSAAGVSRNGRGRGSAEHTGGRASRRTRSVRRVQVLGAAFPRGRPCLPCRRIRRPVGVHSADRGAGRCEGRLRGLPKTGACTDRVAWGSNRTPRGALSPTRGAPHASTELMALIPAHTECGCGEALAGSGQSRRTSPRPVRTVLNGPGCPTSGRPPLVKIAARVGALLHAESCGDARGILG